MRADGGIRNVRPFVRFGKDGIPQSRPRGGSAVPAPFRQGGQRSLPRPFAMHLQSQNVRPFRRGRRPRRPARHHVGSTHLPGRGAKTPFPPRGTSRTPSPTVHGLTIPAVGVDPQIDPPRDFQAPFLKGRSPTVTTRCQAAKHILWRCIP